MHLFQDKIRIRGKSKIQQLLSKEYEGQRKINVKKMIKERLHFKNAGNNIDRIQKNKVMENHYHRRSKVKH